MLSTKLLLRWFLTSCCNVVSTSKYILGFAPLVRPDLGREESPFGDLFYRALKPDFFTRNYIQCNRAIPSLRLASGVIAVRHQANAY